MSHLVASYHGCIKLFFGLDKYYVTGMLMELGLPCFNTLVHNYNISMVNQLNNICKTIFDHECNYSTFEVVF